MAGVVRSVVLIKRLHVEDAILGFAVPIVKCPKLLGRPRR